MSASIKPFLNGAVFDPRHVKAMGRAFDKVTEALDGEGQSRVVRELAATKIIAIAMTGERDPNKLCNRTLEHVRRFPIRVGFPNQANSASPLS